MAQISMKIPVKYDQEAMQSDSYKHLLTKLIREYGYARPNIESFNMLLKNDTTQEERDEGIIGQDLESMIKSDVTGLESVFKHVENQYVISQKYLFENIRYEVPEHNGEKISPMVAIKQNQNYIFYIYADLIINQTISDNTGNVVKTKVYRIPNLKYLQLPIVTGSDICTTSQFKSPEERILHGIHPMDQLGALSLKRSYILQSSRSHLYNSKMLKQRKLPDEIKDNTKSYIIAKIALISKRDNAFKNSYQLSINIYSDNSITVVMSTSKRQDIEIPFYIVYKAMLGPAVMHDERIATMISSAGDIRYSEQVLNFLITSFGAEYKTKTLNRNDIVDVVYERQLCDRLNEEFIQKQDMDANIYNVTSSYRFPDLFDTEFLLHAINKNVGMTIEESRQKKLEFLSECIFDGIIYALNPNMKDTDIYHIRYQSFLNAGHTIAKFFKQEFTTKTSSKVLGEINTYFKKIKLSDGVDNINDAEVIAQLKASIDTMLASIEKANKGRSKVMESFVRNQAMDVKANPLTNKNTSAPNSQHSTAVCHADMWLKMTGINFGANAETQSIMPRLNHTSFRPWICDVTSHESGAKIGFIRWRSCTTRCPMGVDKVRLINEFEKLWKEENIDEKYTKVFKFLHTDNSVNAYNIQLKHNNEIREQLFKSNDAKYLLNSYRTIYINGAIYKYFIGSPYKLAEMLRMYRRQGKFYRETAIYVDDDHNIYMRCDMGALTVPLIILHKKWKGANDYEVPTTEDWVLEGLESKLSEQHIEDLQMDSIGSQELVNQQVIEFVSHYEAINVKVCDPDSIDTASEQIFSHVMMPQQPFSLSALNVSMSNNSYTQRVTIGTMQISKTASLPFIFDDQKQTYNILYAQAVKMYTIPMTMTLSSFNAINIVNMALNGKNQEDSIIFNKSFIDRGGYRTSYFKIIEYPIESNECLADPREVYKDNPFEIQKFQNIAKNGIIKKDAIVKYYNPLVFITKRIKGTNSSPIPHYMEYPHHEVARVVGINIISRTKSLDGNVLIRIHLEIIKTMATGDKGSTNNGCKYTVGQVIDEANLPCLANGTRPTGIMGPCTVPTRMVNNQQMQQSSRFSYAYNVPIDSTCFNKITPQFCIDALNKLTPRNYSFVRLTNKLVSGEKLLKPAEASAKKFKCSYKLSERSFDEKDLFNEYHHFSFIGGNMNKKGENQFFSSVNGHAFEKYANIGPIVTIRIVKFAVDSSIVLNNIAKLRLGEMEFMILAATALNALIEKSHSHSDGRDQTYCSVCGSLAYIMNYSTDMEKIYGKCSNSECTNTTKFYRKSMRGEVIKFHNVLKAQGMELKQYNERMQTIHQI